MVKHGYIINQRVYRGHGPDTQLQPGFPTAASNHCRRVGDRLVYYPIPDKREQQTGFDVTGNKGIDVYSVTDDTTGSEGTRKKEIGASDRFDEKNVRNENKSMMRKIISFINRKAPIESYKEYQRQIESLKKIQKDLKEDLRKTEERINKRIEPLEEIFKKASIGMNDNYMNDDE